MLAKISTSLLFKSVIFIQIKKNCVELVSYLGKNEPNEINQNLEVNVLTYFNITLEIRLEKLQWY